MAEQLTKTLSSRPLATKSRQTRRLLRPFLLLLESLRKHGRSELRMRDTFVCEVGQGRRPRPQRAALSFKRVLCVSHFHFFWFYFVALLSSSPSWKPCSVLLFSAPSQLWSSFFASAFSHSHTLILELRERAPRSGSSKVWASSGSTGTAKWGELWGE